MPTCAYLPIDAVVGHANIGARPAPLMDTRGDQLDNSRQTESEADDS